MLRRIETDILEQAAGEVYDALLAARAMRGALAARTPQKPETRRDADSILILEETLVVALGHMSVSGVPIPAMPSEETAPDPPHEKAKRKP